MQQFADVVVNISNWIWGPPLLILLSILSIFLSIKLGFFQFTKIGYIFSTTLGKTAKRNRTLNDNEGTVSAFGALTSALACTVGAGNITGVPVAIVLGGPGAVFWMWLIAFLGMALKYSEILLSVKYREKNEKGEWDGGPQKYMSKALPGGWKCLAHIFAVCLMIEVAISSMTQANSLAVSAEASLGIPPIATGIVIMILTGIVLLGGIVWLAKFTEKLVPVMGVIYIVASLVIVIMNIGEVPAVIALIFKDAFTPAAAVGGFAGSTIALAVRWGFARGLYSNEAGVGTAPIAHSTAITDHPARQGMWGIIEIFFDTIVICTCTAFVILTSGIWTAEGSANQGGAALSTQAFAANFGNFGGIIVTVSLLLFVFSTLVVLIWYGEKQSIFIFKSLKAGVVYRTICTLLIPVGAIGAATYLWQFLDLSLALCVIPNLIAIFLLRKEVIETSNEFFHTPGKYYMLDMERAKEEKK